MREGIDGGAVGCRLTDESGSWDGNSHEELARAAGILARRGPDRLPLGRAGRLVHLPRLELDRAAGAGRAQRRGRLRPHHEGSRECPGDRDRPHRRPGRRRRDDRARRLRRLRHDAGADHRPLDAEHGPRPASRSRPASAATRGASATTTPASRSPARSTPGPGTSRRCPRPTPGPSPGTVVVVGAGPGGASAAACAAARGHRVVVFERGEAVGGQMRLALNASGHAEIARGMVRTVEAWLAGADVRLGGGRRTSTRCWPSRPTA